MLFKTKREKVFGLGRAVPLDRNAKVRIQTYAAAWGAQHRTERQHRGPITRAFLEVLEALLWGFHNSRDGRCFPSYEKIAEKAQCARSTVYEALKVLELAGVLTWQNRITRIRERAPDLFGQWGTRWRVIRTSNAYAFRDPNPGASSPVSSKSEKRSGTQHQDNLSTTAVPSIDPDTPLGRALNRLGGVIEQKEERLLLNGSGLILPAT